MTRPVHPRGGRAIPGTGAAAGSDARACAREAERLQRAGKRREAAAQWQRAVAASPTDARLRYQLGRQLLELQEREAGALQLEAAIELDGTMLAALLELAQAYTTENRFDAARAPLDRALALAPRVPQVHLVYGTFLHKRGRLPEAIVHFRKALALTIEHPVSAEPAPPRGDFDKPETERLLWTTLSELALVGVHAFAAFGTLLGIVREGGLLPFDKDLDIGVPYGEMDRTAACLAAHGWAELAGSFLVNPRSFVHRKLLVTIDVSGFAVDRDSSAAYEGIWSDAVPWAWNRLTRWPSLSLTKAASPQGRPVWALRDPENWLQTIYGDWRTPDPDFDTIIAARNLCGFSLMTQCYAFGRIYERWHKGKLRKALAATRHSLRHLPEDPLLIKVERCLAALVAGRPPRRAPPASGEPTADLDGPERATARPETRRAAAPAADGA